MMMKDTPRQVRSPMEGLPRVQRFVAVLWPSFLMAGLATVLFLRVSQPAGVLLLPYWGWVTFATVLNASLWWLNRSTAGS